MPYVYKRWFEGQSAEQFRQIRATRGVGARPPGSEVSRRLGLARTSEQPPSAAIERAKRGCCCASPPAGSAMAYANEVAVGPAAIGRVRRLPLSRSQIRPGALRRGRGVDGNPHARAAGGGIDAEWLKCARAGRLDHDVGWAKTSAKASGQW